jgi:hypothetical protein
MAKPIRQWLVCGWRNYSSKFGVTSVQKETPIQMSNFFEEVLIRCPELGVRFFTETYGKSGGALGDLLELLYERREGSG